ncbi:hypothetical protein AURDEDRAFT_128003 [Auricularia subglabra TFB-10046 SS5]|nr:hypothetical protein AURDEDRAFT_128003 [Auricularia subglabra TFB-10046 SS5]
MRASALYALEAQHSRIRQQYEEELLKLRNEPHHARQQAHNTLNPEYPPGLGPASANAQPPPLQQAPLQPQLTPAPPSLQAQGLPPQQQDRDRDMAQRDPKRIKAEKPQSCESDQRSSATGLPLQVAVNPPAKAHPSRGRGLHNSNSNHSSSRCISLRLSPSSRRHPRSRTATWTLSMCPPSTKHGQDWVAVFNPRVPRMLDVNQPRKWMWVAPVPRLLLLIAPAGLGHAKKRIRTGFKGHGQEIYSLDFSRDGALIVSGSGDKTARIWPMDGNGKVTVLAENVDAGVTSVAISPDGRFVDAGSRDTVVCIWDVATGTLIERLQGHQDSVYSVGTSPLSGHPSQDACPDMRAAPVCDGTMTERADSGPEAKADIEDPYAASDDVHWVATEKDSYSDRTDLFSWRVSESGTGSVTTKPSGFPEKTNSRGQEEWETWSGEHGDYDTFRARGCPGIASRSPAVGPREYGHTVPLTTLGKPSSRWHVQYVLWDGDNQIRERPLSCSRGP